mmetsp:Transcript_12435/g.23601  ORF Transcript_12435/g.23601 Transcript_12435/m.23601 type:complete len:207 (+) Transcript_12435:29-649(+)|eukprot:CAMPEP_0114248678 /NCGR_PEP_ID=MMETSP0058-20121206/13708_1 /TAXON_ID=36894 /ORGANISM="Pyramimonas parkeae, CCMP726" /LENGTH=206 /DNA_ID=CAMNT_0001362115 /DNA_START=27 /DNA_END=647 /DNA_ORIENTATION=-
MGKRKAPEVDAEAPPIPDDNAAVPPSLTTPPAKKTRRDGRGKPKTPSNAPNPTSDKPAEEEDDADELADDKEGDMALEADYDDIAPAEPSREEADEHKRSRMKAILARLTPEQMERYECYRRSALQRASMKRLMQSMVTTTVTQPMTIVMSGIAKLFVGDIVEHAKTAMAEWGDTGPLRPVHIREAFRRVSNEGKLPVRHKAQLFQ